jgi:hypothetical protein
MLAAMVFGDRLPRSVERVRALYELAAAVRLSRAR